MNMNRIIIQSCDVESLLIRTRISIEGDSRFQNLFLKNKFDFLTKYNTSIADVPISVAVIPAICVLLPVAWVFDAIIECPELDKSFYDCIPEICFGYKNMYPTINFGGKIETVKIINNQYNADRCVVMFSGGVDAFNTLSSNYDQNPDLLTIWGADVATDNETGWKPVKEQLNTISERFGLKSYCVKSNCRRILNEKELNSQIKRINPKYNWWHDFQHGICIISHSAPLAYVNRYRTVYIASTFTANDIGHYTCASDPTIDNKVRFCTTNVIHDGYEFSRQAKIHNICEFRNKTQIQIPLRVCYESKKGDNCCRCEKCYRTISGILAERADPVSLGFTDFNEKRRKKMMHDMRFYRIPNYNFRYKYIQNRLKENYTYSECPKDLRWFYNLRIDEDNPQTRYRKAWRFKRKIMRGFTKLFGIKW